MIKQLIAHELDERLKYKESLPFDDTNDARFWERKTTSRPILFYRFIAS